MLTIYGTTSEPCFLCPKAGIQLKWANGSFAGRLCLEHLGQKLKPVVKKGREENGQPSTRTAEVK